MVAKILPSRLSPVPQGADHLFWSRKWQPECPTAPVGRHFSDTFGYAHRFFRAQRWDFARKFTQLDYKRAPDNKPLRDTSCCFAYSRCGAIIFSSSFTAHCPIYPAQRSILALKIIQQHYIRAPTTNHVRVLQSSPLQPVATAQIASCIASTVHSY